MREFQWSVNVSWQPSTLLIASAKWQSPAPGNAHQVALIKRAAHEEPAEQAGWRRAACISLLCVCSSWKLQAAAAQYAPSLKHHLPAVQHRLQLHAAGGNSCGPSSYGPGRPAAGTGFLHPLSCLPLESAAEAGGRLVRWPAEWHEVPHLVPHFPALYFSDTCSK